MISTGILIKSGCSGTNREIMDIRNADIVPENTTKHIYFKKCNNACSLALNTTFRLVVKLRNEDNNLPV